MKIYILTLISVLIVSASIAGNGNLPIDKEPTRLVTGKVIDKSSGEELAGAEIKIADKVIYTDLNGNFITTIPVNTEAAIISFVSYNPTTVTFDPHSYGEMLATLEAK